MSLWISGTRDMTILSSCWCWNSSRKFSECILTWKSLNFEYLCWMLDVWKMKRLRSQRCSPTSTTTTAPTIEQLPAVQIQLMQALVQNQQNQPIGGVPHNKRGEFLKHCPPSVFTCHWSTRRKWLALCSGKATQHSAMRRPAEGVVRVRTTLGRSSRLVGGIWVWTSH